MSRYERLFRTTEEQSIPIDASLTGNVPEWLDGKLLRVCPAVFELDSGFTVNHFFDGYSVLFKFEISKGEIRFCKKILKSDAYLRAQKNGRPAFCEYGTRAYAERNEVSIGFLARAISNFIPDITDNCNIDIIKLGNSYFTIKGTYYMRSIDPEDLSTGEKVDLYPRIGVYLTAKHVIQDHNGDSYTAAFEQMNNPSCNIFRVPYNSNKHSDVFKDTTMVSKVEPRFRNFFLSNFGMTDNYIILIETPLEYSRLKKSAIKTTTLADRMKWLSDQLDRFYIIEKSTGSLHPVVYESKEPFFFFHVINCYEDNKKIIIDVIGYDSPDVLKHLDIRHLRKGLFDPVHRPQARRYIIPLIEDITKINDGYNLLDFNGQDCKAIKHGNKIQLAYQVLCHSAHENPTINKKYVGKKYRYYYATGYFFTGENEFSVIKVDIETGEVKKWFAGDGQVPCGPTFVEKPNWTAEDDGIILVCLTSSLNGDKDRMVILDARNLEVIVSATVTCHVPLSRGGIFIEG